MNTEYTQTVYRAITVGKDGKLIQRDQPKLDSFMTLNRNGSLTKKAFVKEVSQVTITFRKLSNGKSIPTGCHIRKVT